MTGILADTHTILWYLFDPGQLSAPALAALKGAVAGGERIYISTVSLIEVCYLVEKAKLPSAAWAGLLSAVTDANTPVDVLPVDLSVALAIPAVPRSVVPDLPDRIIGATSKTTGLTLVTRDAKLLAAPIKTIW